MGRGQIASQREKLMKLQRVKARRYLNTFQITQHNFVLHCVHNKSTINWYRFEKLVSLVLHIRNTCFHQLNLGHWWKFIHFSALGSFDNIKREFINNDNICVLFHIRTTSFLTFKARLDFPAERDFCIIIIFLRNISSLAMTYKR